MEIKALKTKNKSLNTNVTDLKKQLKSAQENVEKYQKLYKDATSRTIPPQKLTAVRSELEQAQGELKVRVKEVTDLNTRLSHAQRLLGESRAEAERWHAEAVSQTEGARAFQATCDALEQALRGAQEEARSAEETHKQDQVRVQDLQRQVSEMERILRRGQQHLAVGETGGSSSALVQHLEARVQQLTEQLSERGETARSRILALEQQFTNIKESYESYIQELEQKLSNVAERDPGASAPRREPRTASRSPAQRTDEHLLATVRGLQTELATRDREVQRLSRELAELKSSKPRQERGRASNSKTASGSAKVLPAATQTKSDGQIRCENSLLSAEVYELQQEITILRDQMTKLTATNQRLTMDLTGAQQTLSRLANQSQEAIAVLKNRHREEVQRLASQQSGDVSSRLVDLETKLTAQTALVSRLKEELAKALAASQESELWRLEKEHLESCVSSLSKEVAELRRNNKPESEQLASLRAKLESLEQRHVLREVRLQAVVREVLRHRAAAAPHPEVEALREALRLKNQQIAGFQAELVRLMDSLKALQKAKAVT